MKVNVTEVGKSRKFIIRNKIDSKIATTLQESRYKPESLKKMIIDMCTLFSG